MKPGRSVFVIEFGGLEGIASQVAVAQRAKWNLATYPAA